MSLLANLRSNTYRAEEGFSGNGTFFFGAGLQGEDLYVDSNNSAWYFKAYQYCPTVGSICNRKAEAFINGDTLVLSTKDADKGKASETEEAKKIRRLTKRPNPLQNWTQFEAQYYLYYQIYGYCPILAVKANGFKNIDTKALWIIPPVLIDIEETRKIWYNDDGANIISKIALKYRDETATLNWEDILLLKDFVPSGESMIIPDSRFRSLRIPIETVIKGFRAMSSAFENTPLGIIGNDTRDASGAIPLKEGEKQELQTALAGYGLGVGMKKFIISNANLTWNAINYPIDSLRLPEHTKMANAAICDGLGYPFPLLSNEKGVTFDNGNTAEKSLYQNFIIPVSKSIYEQWNEFFETEKYGLKVVNEFNHLPILQEDDVKKSTARLILNQALKIEYDQGLLTINGWLAKLGEEPIGDAGDIRATDIKDDSTPLASIIGVGGVQSLIGVLTASGISEEARAATMQILFGISAENAALMTQGATAPATEEQTN